MINRFKNKAIINGTIITPFEILEDKVVISEGPIIASIENGNFKKFGIDVEIIDAGGSYIIPGFIDLHVHGGGSFDTMDGTPGSLENIA